MVEPNDIAAEAPDAAWIARLAAYWAARKPFVEVGRGVQPSARAPASHDRAGARALLLELMRLQPARPEATEALRALDA